MQIDRGSAVRKRQKVEAKLSPLETARQRWKEMRKLKAEDLLDPTKATSLPYPGWGDATGRPAINDVIVGVRDVRDIIEEYKDLVIGQAVMLVGSKGIGKTVRLRILACIMYVEMYGTWNRLISLWNLGSLTDCGSLLISLKRALLFTYCEDGKQVQAIEGITSLEEAYAFIDNRRVTGDMFTLILDGAHALDVETYYGSECGNEHNLSEVMTELDKLVFHAKTIWGISSAAEQAVAYELPPSPDVTICRVTAGFNAEAFDTYLEHTVLGRVIECSPQRKADLQYYAGCHPMFLSIFVHACRRVAAKKNNNASVTDERVLELLQDQEDWDAVVQEFLTHPEIKEHLVQCRKDSVQRH